MGMGTRKILQSDAQKMSQPQQIVIANQEVYSQLSDNLNTFIDQSELQGKGWSSAKQLAEIYQTINRSFEMVSEQLSSANQKVIQNQSNLLDSQIDEQALKNQINQNNASMTQLAYANTIWNSSNPGKPNPSSSIQRSIQQSLGNENAELQKTLDSLNDFDLSTKYAYDEVKGTFELMASILKSLSDIKNNYDSSSGLFTLKNINMENFEELKGRVIAYVPVTEKDLIDFLSENTDLPYDKISEFATILKYNPSSIMSEILNNENLVDAFLYKSPKNVTRFFLSSFTKFEHLDKIPGKTAEKIINSQVFIRYASSHPKVADKMLDFTITLQEKGFSVLAPIKNLADIAGQGNVGKAAVKTATKLLEKAKKFSPFFKAAGIARTSLVIINNFSDEFFDYDSPAYNNIDKAAYGAICLYALESGPLEQGELFAIIGNSITPGAGAGGGAMLGIATGTVNTIGQYVGFIDKERNLINLYDVYDKLNDSEKVEESLKDNYLWKIWKDSPNNPDNGRA